MTRLLILATLFALAACQSGSSDENAGFGLFSPEGDMMAEEQVARDVAGAAPPVVPAAQNQAPDPGPDPATEQRRLIRRAEVRLRVDDYAEAREDVGTLVDQFDGYIGDEAEQRYPSRIENTLTIRIDAARFDSLMAALLEVGDEIDFRNVTTEDVTRQYVDLEARLNARRAVEERYKAILSQADDIEEILAVEQRLAQTREEIESAEGQLRFLSNQVSLSTITLTLFEESNTGLIAGPSFIGRIGDAIGTGWDAVLEMLIAIVALWPLWVLIALGIPLFRRFNRRMVARRKAKLAAVAPQG